MKKCFFVCIFLKSIYSFGQVDKPAVLQPFIEVVGTASKEVVPDKIFISIILSEKVIGTTKYTIQAQEDKLKKVLAKVNIDLRNLYLTDASSEITLEKKKETGFKVTKEFTLQVKNADEVSKVFKELYAIDIKEASIDKTESSNIDSLRREVRIAAIKAAKEKAEYLVAAIGEQIGKPLEIHEQEDNPYYRNILSNNSNLSSSAVEKPDETSFQKFAIKFSYYIKYSIK